MIVILLLQVSLQPLGAQGLCDVGGGGFSLDRSEGCAPLTVNITNEIKNAVDVGYLINYDGQSTSNLAFTDRLSIVTYTAPGDFRILQKAVVGDNINYSCNIVKVFEGRPVNGRYITCGNTKVVLILYDDIILKAYDKVSIDWGDGTTQEWQRGNSLLIEHDYFTTSISPVIRVIGKYNDDRACDRGAERSFPINFSQAGLNDIQINKLAMNGNGVLEITYAGVNDISTDILYSTSPNGPFTKAATRTSGGQQLVRIYNLDPKAVYYTKLISKDLCGGELETEPITSIVLHGKTENEKNFLSWNQFVGLDQFDHYEIVRDGVVVETLSDSTATGFTDENVQCGDVFEYQIIAKSKTETSLSATLNIKTLVDNPLPIDYGLVSVLDDNTISISSKPPGGGMKTNYAFIFEKFDQARSEYKRIATLYGENEFLDQDVNTREESYCYRVTYQNGCGQKTEPTKPVCSILLKVQRPTITWTAGNPFVDSLDYYVVMQRTTTETEIPVNKMVSYLPEYRSTSDLEYTFQIKAISKDTLQSYSNTITINKDVEVFVPEAFSPNGDGVNDLFMAEASLMKSFELFVYNKWGQVIYYTDDISKGWDGKFNGELAPVGSYGYRIQLVDIIDQKLDKQGVLVLLR